MRLSKAQQEALKYVDKEIDTDFIFGNKLVCAPQTIRSLLKKGLIRHCKRHVVGGDGYCLTAKGYCQVRGC